MAKVQSWEVSDSFWARVEPLIPKPKRDPNSPSWVQVRGTRRSDPLSSSESNKDQLNALPRIPTCYSVNGDQSKRIQGQRQQTQKKHIDTSHAA